MSFFNACSNTIFDSFDSEEGNDVVLYDWCKSTLEVYAKIVERFQAFEYASLLAPFVAPATTLFLLNLTKTRENAGSSPSN